MSHHRAADVGVHGLSADDLAIDRELADLAGSFRFILDVSPVNVRAVRDGYLSGQSIDFEYRELDDDMDVVRSRMAKIDVGGVQHPILATLFDERRREMDIQIEMLECRNTSDFLPLSVELFGGVGPRLLTEAESILAEIVPTRTEPTVDAADFAAHVERELALYRAIDDDFDVHVDVRDDISSVMVAANRVLVPVNLKMSPERVEALIQHEVGTHALTYVNGTRQPLHLLASGLAGYEATQEGLAVFVEYLVGGLTAKRLRTLAGRVVAVHALIEGASFDDCIALLRDVHGFQTGSAFSLATRVYRSGGLTKDALYLRGLLDVLTHVGLGKDIEPLWMGKMALESLPLLLALRDDGALSDPLLLPAFMSRPDVRDLISNCTADATVLDLYRRTT